MLHEQDLCYKWEMLVMAINIAVNINFKAFQLYMSWTGVNNMIYSFNTVCPFQKNLFIVYM